MRTFLASDPVRRTVRTFLQAFIGILVVSFRPDVIASTETVLSVLQTASWAGVVALVTFAHNELESHNPGIDQR